MGEETPDVVYHYRPICNFRNPADSDWECEGTSFTLAEHYCDEHFPLAQCWLPTCDRQPDVLSTRFCTGHFKQYLASGMATEWLFVKNGLAKPLPPEKPKAPTSAERQVVALTAEVAALTEQNLRAMDVARRLWAAMPAEGKVAYFEAGNLWLPDWVAGDAAQSG